MFITTRGIVLRTYPFRDKKLIVKIFTKDDGLVSCVVRRNKSQIILSELLTIAEITYKKTKNQSLVYIKECRVDYVYRSLTISSNKIQCAIMLCEILNKCITELNSELYDFVTEAFKWLDSQKSYLVGFDCLFLIRFCQIVGISPLQKDSTSMRNCVLDISEGRYVDGAFGEGSNFVPNKESYLIYQLSSMGFSDLKNFNLKLSVSDEILNYLITYISVHLVDLTKLKSIHILKELSQ